METSSLTDEQKAKVTAQILFSKIGGNSDIPEERSNANILLEMISHYKMALDLILELDEIVDLFVDGKQPDPDHLRDLRNSIIHLQQLSLTELSLLRSFCNLRAK